MFKSCVVFAAAIVGGCACHESGGVPPGFAEALIRHELASDSYLRSNIDIGGYFVQISDETPAIDSQAPVPLSSDVLDRLADIGVRFFRTRKWDGKNGILLNIHTPVPRADGAYEVRHSYDCPEDYSRCGAGYLSTMIRHRHGWEVVKTTGLWIQ